MKELLPSMAGEFTIGVPGLGTFVKKNTMVQAGALAFLQTLFQNGTVIPSSFWLGVCSLPYDFSTTLADVAATEPTAGGYARIEFPRDSTNWTADLVGNAYRMRSVSKNFTATDDWNKTWTQMFLCDVAAGTSGKLYAISGPLSTPVQTLKNVPPPGRYTYYIRGLGSEA